MAYYKNNHRQKNEGNIAIVYHAERLSPIEGVRYLSFFDDKALRQTSNPNSLKHDIAVIYCIFANTSDIRYRSQQPPMLKCQAEISYLCVFNTS